MRRVSAPVTLIRSEEMAARRRPYRETPPTYSNRDNTRGRESRKAPPPSDPAGRPESMEPPLTVEAAFFEGPPPIEFFEPIERKVLALRHFEELSQRRDGPGPGPGADGGQQPLHPCPQEVEGDPGRPAGLLRGLSRARPIPAGVPHGDARHDVGPQPGRPAGRGVPRAAPARRAARDRRVRRAAPRVGRRDPRGLPGPGDDGAAQARARGASTGSHRGARPAGPARPSRAAGRLPHPPRDRPRGAWGSSTRPSQESLGRPWR